MGKEQSEILLKKLNIFIKKYYWNLIIKGGLVTILVLLFSFISFSVLEYYGQFNIKIRMILFWFFILLLLLLIIVYILVPILKLNRFGEALTHEDAGKIIGNHFEEINDKIINIIQLNNMDKKDTSLIQASIDRKISLLSSIKFTPAIDFKETYQLFKWVLIPFSIILLLFITEKGHILKESSARIIKYNTLFEATAPFNYVFNNKLEIPQFEDFNLSFNIEGDLIPEKVYIVLDNNKFQLKSSSYNSFEYVFKSVSSDINFSFFSGGFHSSIYTLTAIPRPSILDFSTFLDYPKYIDKKDETLNNIGDLEVPEGTLINWAFKLQNTNYLTLSFGKNNNLLITPKNNIASFEKTLLNNSLYKIKIQNQFNLVDSMLFNLTVIKDLRPKINITEIIDSSLGPIFFKGIIEDDYQLSSLTFNYKHEASNSFFSQAIPINNLSKELFLFSFDFNTLDSIKKGNINYFFEVWDNDQINGSKSSKSTMFNFKILSEKELEDNISKTTTNLKSQLSESINNAKTLKKEIIDLNNSLLEKKEFSWEEKQKIAAIIKQQKQLESKLKSSKKINTQISQSREKTSEKQKNLESLINSLIDEETQKLLKKLEKLLEENDKKRIKDLLEKLAEKNNNLDTELERDLEILKQLEFESKLETILTNLNKIKTAQENLKNNTTNNKTTLDSLIKNQEDLQKEMDSIVNKLDDLNNNNNKLENKNSLPKTDNFTQKIQKNMQNSSSNLKQKNKKNSSKSQQKAINNLKELDEKLQVLQKSCSSDIHVEDLQTLRQILENLLVLSFNQEALITEVNNVSKNSPSFLLLVKEQKKLELNSKIIQDSLFALSKRVSQLQPSINKEIYSIQNNMKKATSELENRSVKTAASTQQFIMTSTNNLALLLSELLKSMQKNIANKCNKPGSKQCNKPGGSPSLSLLKTMQKKLNQKMKTGSIKTLKENGRLSSKELANLLKEQEQIKHHLEKIRNSLNKNHSRRKLNKIIEQIEDNETDIINNKITNKTFKRHEDIIVRLLEVEKAEREQGNEKKLESVEWYLNTIDSNESFLEYKKIKQQQQELIQTTPVRLTPFYKRKVNEYFNLLLKK